MPQPTPAPWPMPRIHALDGMLLDCITYMPDFLYPLTTPAPPVSRNPIIRVLRCPYVYQAGSSKQRPSRDWPLLRVQLPV